MPASVSGSPLTLCSFSAVLFPARNLPRANIGWYGLFSFCFIYICLQDIPQKLTHYLTDILTDNLTHYLMFSAAGNGKGQKNPAVFPVPFRDNFSGFRAVVCHLFYQGILPPSKRSWTDYSDAAERKRTFPQGYQAIRFCFPFRAGRRFPVFGF